MARSAMTKAKRGLFKDTAPEAMLAPILKACCQKAGVDPKHIEDIAVGNVLAPGAGATTSRMATFLAGFPETVSVYAVNRQCSSGLTAVGQIANAVASGQIDFGIGAGVENMSMYKFTDSLDIEKVSELVYDNEDANNCM